MSRSPASNVVIVDAVRTPIGKRGGDLSTLHPAEVLSKVQRAIVERSARNHVCVAIVATRPVTIATQT